MRCGAYSCTAFHSPVDLLSPSPYLFCLILHLLSSSLTPLSRFLSFSSSCFISHLSYPFSPFLFFRIIRLSPLPKGFRLSDEMINMAERLGIKAISEPQLLWIARDALSVSLPAQWIVLKVRQIETSLLYGVIAKH